MFTLVLTAAFAALPLLAQSATAAAASCARSYTVKQGDICDSISATQNVSTYQLAALNQDIIDSQCRNLVPGEIICLGFPGEDCSTTYVVVANDTCNTITSKAGVNATILALNNPQINSDCSNIYIGEVLCTSSSVEVPPAPAGPVPASAIPSTANPAVPSAPPAVSSNPPTTPAPASDPTPLVSAASGPPSTSASHVVPSAITSTASDAAGDDDDDSELPFCDEV